MLLLLPHHLDMALWALTTASDPNGYS